MMSSAKTRGDFRLGTSALCSAAKARVLDSVPAAIGSHVTPLRTRRGQSLALSFDSGETALIVRSGVLTLQVTLPDSSRQIAAVFFAGDLLRSSFAPPHAHSVLVAASAGEVWRIRLAALHALAATDSAILRYLEDATASRVARQAIHAATLGQFDCEQRVATLLLELALRTGVSSPNGGVAFEIPFSRAEIADYLGLNPDTLSRIMSRLRAAGIIGHADRNRAVARDLAALAARSPAARFLVEVNGARLGEALRAPAV